MQIIITMVEMSAMHRTQFLHEPDNLSSVVYDSKSDFLLSKV
jgi:hypothetical protein